jgi:hypothetical protein
MAIELVKEQAEWALVLGGVVDIFDVAALHAVALEAVTGAPSGIVARLGSAESVDAAVTQVLLALKRALAADARTLTLEGAAPGVLEFWRRAGLAEELG